MWRVALTAALALGGLAGCSYQMGGPPTKATNTVASLPPPDTRFGPRQ